ncbi:MAG TPA: type VI secretion system baseplate subunit TssK [Polyangiaceae bacterium]|jgi:type VI secretion system protein ImpJ
MVAKPIWTEGLLLSQHHFQQQDRYHEELLGDRVRAIAHYPWGVSSLELDERALSSGQFKIRRLAAIWPDGASLVSGEGSSQPAPAPRSFEAAFTPELQRLEIFVGLAHESASALLEDRAKNIGARRYVRESHSVADLNTGSSAQEVEYARPNLRVFFGGELQDGFSTIRIAELVRQANGQVIVRDNHVPPVLHWSSAPFLVSGLQRVLTGITARQRQLSSDRNQRQVGNVEFHSSDARKFWLLHTLNAAMPALNHILETGRAHPEEVYLCLTGLAGQLCSFAPDADPLSFPKFNYLELGVVFEELFARVLSLLSGGIEQAYVEIPLEHRPDGMFIGKVADSKLFAHEFFLAVQAKLSEALVRERVPGVLKMASWNQIYEVVKQARHGVRTEIEWNPSGALPLRPGVCFFRVRREGPFWEDISKTSSLALYLPVDADWSGTTLSLYAVDPAHLR